MLYHYQYSPMSVVISVVHKQLIKTFTEMKPTVLRHLPWECGGGYLAQVERRRRDPQQRRLPRDARREQRRPPIEQPLPGTLIIYGVVACLVASLLPCPTPGRVPRARIGDRAGFASVGRAKRMKKWQTLTLLVLNRQLLGVFDCLGGIKMRKPLYLDGHKVGTAES